MAAAFKILINWLGFKSDDGGFAHFSIAEFNL